MSEPDITALLDRAKRQETQARGELLQMYRNYLTVLATTQFDARLRRRLSPSDIVQDALLAAHRDFDQFRGVCERELLMWLRQILIHALHGAYDTHLRARCRDMRNEISIEVVSQALDRSVVRLAQRLADPGPSPSAPAQERERSVRMADQLSKLKSDYRDVIVLRNLQGLTFDEVAERMQRKTGTVRMLWIRAIDKLRQVYEPVA